MLKQPEATDMGISLVWLPNSGAVTGCFYCSTSSEDRLSRFPDFPPILALCTPL